MIKNSEIKTYLVPKKYQRIIIVNSGELHIRVCNQGKAVVFMKNSHANAGEFRANWQSSRIMAPSSISSVDKSLTIENSGKMTIKTNHPTQVILKSNNGQMDINVDKQTVHTAKSENKQSKVKKNTRAITNKKQNQIESKDDTMSNDIRKTVTVDYKADNGNHVKKVTKIDDKGNELISERKLVLSKNRKGTK